MATEVRAAVALALARQGRPSRLEVVDDEVVVELPSRAAAARSTRVRARVTDEPVELQAERIVETLPPAETEIATFGLDPDTRAWCAID